MYRGKLKYRMPFDELFWREAERADDAGQHSWNVRYDSPQRPDEVAGLAPEAKPGRIQGFISALPVQWTAQESNNTQFALAVLAGNERAASPDGTQLASADVPAGVREGIAG